MSSILRFVPADVLWEEMSIDQRRRIARLAGPAWADVSLAERIAGRSGADILAALSEEQRREAAGEWASEVVDEMDRQITTINRLRTENKELAASLETMRAEKDALRQALRVAIAGGPTPE